MGNAPHLEAFLQAARDFVGLKESPPKSNTFKDPRGRELWDLAGVGSGMAWCAAFVSACAQKAGIANIVIAKHSRAPIVAKLTVELYGGTFIDGPYINGGNPVIPQPGDLITFGNKGHHGHDAAYHIGLVEFVDDRVHTIEGNAGDNGECKTKDYAFDYESINLYVRPDWSRVGDVVGTETPEIEAFTPLYNNYNDRHDMTLRQVCYLDKQYNLSNSVSSIAISTINYTTMLGTLYDSLAPAYSTNISVDTSQLSGNERIAIDYFMSMGYPASSACALAGCLSVYSHLDPTNVINRNNKYYYGIGAWEYDKLKILKSGRSDTNISWDIDLSNQLVYFLSDIFKNYSDLMVHLKSKQLSEDDVRQAVDEFMNTYNPIFTQGGYIQTAQDIATLFYSKLIIIEGDVIGTTAYITDINGNQLHAQYSIDIPPELPQTGIIDDFTSYSRWYYRWDSSSPQRKLSRIWGDQGFPCDRGIATIGGYYCCAVRPKFGRCGDVIHITLQNGVSFNGIICDEKGDDAGSEWGHIKNSKGSVSLIEWERVHTDSSGRVVVARSLDAYNVDSTDGWPDWAGQPVVNITNYGKYVAVDWS